jgi:hypothetical protein
MALRAFRINVVFIIPHVPVILFGLGKHAPN